MKKYSHFIFFLFLTVSSFITGAQTAKIDSLKIVLGTEKQDSNKIRSLFELCAELKSIDHYQEALNYVSSALKIAEADKNRKAIADSYFRIGNLNYLQQN